MTNLVKVVLIEDYMAKNKLSKTKFSQLCKISSATLDRVLSGGNYSVIALFRIVRVLEVEVHQLFNRFVSVAIDVLLCNVD